MMDSSQGNNQVRTPADLAEHEWTLGRVLYNPKTKKYMAVCAILGEAPYNPEQSHIYSPPRYTELVVRLEHGGFSRFMACQRSDTDLVVMDVVLTTQEGFNLSNVVSREAQRWVPLHK